MRTSYQLAISDERHFQRIKWQYMVLDEAQALKTYAHPRPAVSPRPPHCPRPLPFPAG